MRPRHLVRHPLTLQSWQPFRMRNAKCGMRNLVGAAALILEALCYMAIGAGIAVILQALHSSGLTP